MHKLSNRPNKSFKSPTSWDAVLLEDILVNPTMSANKILTLSMVFMLKGRKIERMSLLIGGLEDRGLFLREEPRNRVKIVKQDQKHLLPDREPKS